MMRVLISRIVVSSLLLIGQIILASASIEDPCNFEVITDSCKVFNPDGPDKIQLTDGSTLFNMVAMSHQEADKLSQSILKRKIAIEEKNSSQYLKLKQRVVQVLSDISNEQMHPTFRFYVANNFTEFIEAVFDKKRSVKPDIELPWPPENPQANKLVSHREVASRFTALLRQEQAEQFQLIFDEMKSLQRLAQNSLEATANENLIRELPSGKKQLAEKYFEFAKKRVISLIRNGLDETSLSQADQRIVRKITSVKLIEFDPKSDLYEQECIPGLPNAFYRPHDNTVTLCPATYFLSESAIIQIVSHEIGHAISPCLSQFGTYEIVSSKLVKAVQGGQRRIIQEINSDSNKLRMFRLLIAINKQSNMTAFPFPLLAGDEAVQYFIRKEIIKPEIPGVSPQQYPFQNVSKCLAVKHGFRGVDDKELRRIASEVVKTRLEYREPNYDANKDERQIVDALSKYPGCLNPEQRESQTEEAIADWISSQVLADYLSGNPLKTSEERLGLVSVFAGHVCKQRFEAQKESAETVSSIFKNVVKDTVISSESHPPSKRRIEKIIFGHPQIRKAAGCKPLRDIACER